MSKSNKTTRTVVMLAVFSFLSKFLGFFRESLIAAKYGSRSDTDVFFLALTTVALFTTIVSSSVGTTLIPVLSEVEKKEGKEGKQNHLNNFVNIIAIASIIMFGVAWIGSPLVLKILAKGFDDQSFNLVVTLARIGLPSIFFSSLIGVYRGYLQSEGLFRESATSGLVTNVILIIFLVLLSDHFDVRGLMVAYVIAQAAPILVQMKSLKSKGYKYDFIIDIRDKYMIKVMGMIPPILIGVAISDFNSMVDNSLASSLVEGSVSALNYARKLDAITMGIFIASIMTAVFPLLAEQASKETTEGLKKVITRGLNLILMITIPATIGMIVLARPIVVIAFERGLFDSVATNMTVGALVFYSIGLSASAIKQFLNRAFYSLQDIKTPVINSAITVAINISFNFLLIGSLQHKGLALATSLANTITAVILIYLLRKKVGAFGIGSTVSITIKAFISSVLMGLTAHYAYPFIFNAFGQGKTGLIAGLMLSVLLASSVYFIMMLLLKVEELKTLLDGFKRKIKRM